mgnify:CR=1 FL=1
MKAFGEATTSFLYKRSAMIWPVAPWGISTVTDPSPSPE